ncbi:DUF2244 domain-containing protein [Jannaschia sp. Os4]|uniref:DUF2244 domain-containing protein n=1 Tax=Jannaschia sp. Os4 TaxID=2807617 RepID=UPI001939B08F|nr:DUF2244 domain-containing protein [Jannaschia sp. Os4]MBM2577561.1 DUF2244 domain-containing protein [Jannaschia sp. Os4]
MPYSVLRDPQEAPAQSGASSRGADDVVLEVVATPHSSLTKPGFARVVSFMFAALCIPLMGVLATVAFWGILPFAMGALGLLWLALRRSWRDRDIEERLVVTPALARLERRDPKGLREWEANPYWVRVEMHPGERPVENYLTLEGGPRPVEIGAFLTPSERASLRDVIGAGLNAAR